MPDNRTGSGAKQGDGFPPRGSGVKGRLESAAAGVWANPRTLDEAWTWAPGKILLGTWEGRTLGWGDDKHVVTVAGSRAGKSATVLLPNLLRYPGSALVLDPKGDLARDTARVREAMGQAVFVLDPFGRSGIPSASHNPFDELRLGDLEHVSADAALMADALIIGNDRDPHWTDSAKNLVGGIALHLISSGQEATIKALRKLLNADPALLQELFKAMTRSEAFDGVVANIGASFLGKSVGGPQELQSILSTAQEQTRPLDDVAKVTAKSDFALRDLKRQPMTIYLVLPGMRMGTHFRWLRLVIQQALAAMELEPAKPEHPVLFVLEEFATLGYMRPIETAAGFMASFGVKLWTVLQDLSQLKTHYPKSWESVLGNASVIQAFGNADLTTTEHLSKMLGHTTIRENQTIPVSSSAMGMGDLGQREHLRHVQLLEPNEIMQSFAKDTWRQLVLVPGQKPAYFQRLSYAEAAEVPPHLQSKERDG